jgi:glycosyltransferase involved in cell wall biosynthesis
MDEPTRRPAWSASHPEARRQAEEAAGGRRRRVLMVTLHPYPGDAPVRRNAQFLANRGFGVDLICAGAEEDPPNHPPGLRMHRINVGHRRSSALRYAYEYATFFLAALAIASWLSLRHAYVAVQVDNPPDFLVFAAWLARLRGARVVLDMLELGPEMTATALRVPSHHPAVRAGRWLERLATRWADHVITVNEPCKRTVVERGVPAAKVSVVPNTVEASAHRWIGEGLELPRSLVTHCSLIERYGVHVAIRALKELEGDWSDLTLRVLGEGEQRPELERLAADLGLAERVQFAGFLPWDEAMAQICRAAVGLVAVVPDGYGHLLLPTKLMEYVVHGVPVVASRLTTIEEYFPEGTVAYFEPGVARSMAAAIDALLRDPEGARRQAARALETIRSVGWPAVAGRYLSGLGRAPATAGDLPVTA